jgi:hypothetical protein
MTYPSSCKVAIDPVTILPLVGTASRILSSVSAALHRFIQDTKQVDKTTEALFHEVCRVNPPPIIPKAEGHVARMRHLRRPNKD